MIQPGTPPGIDTSFETVAYSATPSITYNPYRPNKQITLTGNIAITNTGTSNGSSGLYRIVQDSTPRTVSINGTSVTVNTTASSVTIISWVYNGSTYSFDTNYSSAAAYDTSVTDGSTNAPTGNAVYDAIVAAPRLNGYRVILNGTTSYTPLAGTTKIRMTLIGGGGGGGGVTGTNSQIGIGGGGASGQTVVEVSTITVIAHTCAVGAGGAGGANTGAVGTTGGDTTMIIGGTTYTAKGGLGGGFSNASATVPRVVAGGAGVFTGGIGDVIGKGMPGGNGYAGSITIGYSGNGGSTMHGGGGLGLIAAGAGNAGEGYGAGGGGAMSTANTARVGGAGSNGIIIIEEFA